MNKYKDWYILKSLPDGWIIDKTCGSPLWQHVFITNGKSVLNGQKRALLKIHFEQNTPVIKKNTIQNLTEPKAKKENQIFPVETVNDLARLKFQEHLLQEIRFDLMVCELEGWDKKNYIAELQNLLNGFDVQTKG